MGCPAQDLKQFMVKTAAEAIAGLLKRCPAYPDVPCSHWDRAVVRTYCYYRHQPLVSLDDMRQLVREGYARELDRRLIATLDANVYFFHTHEWDKAWKTTDKAIEKFPDVPYGWVLRAKLQEATGRPGLQATLHEFSKRFGSDPQQQGNLSWMQGVVAKQTQKAHGDAR